MFQSTKHDFGDVASDQILTHTFEFTNIGQTNLRVLKVHKSCGCLSAQDQFEPCGPGESQTIEVRLGTDGIAGPLFLKRLVAVEFDSPSTPQISLELSAFVQPDIEVIPSSLLFSDGQDVPLQVQVRRKMMPQETFRKIALTASGITYEIMEKERSEDAVTYDVRSVKSGAGPEMLPLLVSLAGTASSTDDETVVRIPCRRTGPTLKPSACVMSISDSVTEGELPDESRQIFVFHGGEDLRIVSLKFENESDQDLFLPPVLDGCSFSLCLRRFPADRGFDTNLEVRYEDVTRQTSGRLLLPIRFVLYRSNKWPN